MNRKLLLASLVFLSFPVFPGPLEEAKALESKGSAKEAIGKYRLWLRDNPGDGRFSEVLLHTADLFTSPKDAVVFLKQVLDLEKDASRRSLVCEKMGSFLEILGDYENAQKYYELAYKSDSKNASLENLFKSAQLLLELGEFQTSEEQVRVVANSSKDPGLKKKAILHIARIMAFTGREQEALKLARLLTEDPSYTSGNEGILYFIVALSRHTGESKEESAALERLKKEYPEAVETVLASGAKNTGAAMLFPSPIFFLIPSTANEKSAFPDERRREVQAPSADRETKPANAQETKPPKTVKSEPSSPDSIQTGSFSVKENAEYMVKDLKKLGFEAEIREAFRRDGKKIYKVVIPLSGEQKTPEGTQKALILLKEKGVEGFLLFP